MQSHYLGKRSFKSVAVKHFIEVFISAVVTHNDTPLFTDQVLVRFGLAVLELFVQFKSQSCLISFYGSVIFIHMSRQGLSWKAKLKYAIDQAIAAGRPDAQDLAKCADFGVLVEYNPDHKIDLKFMLAEQKEHNPRAKFTRSRTLGWFYETEQIKSRIAQYQGCMVYVPRTKIKVVTPKVEENRFVNRFVRNAIDRGNMKVASIAKNIPTVENLEKSITALRAKLSAMNTKFNQVDKKARELADAQRTIEEYLRQEQRRDQQKRKKRNDLE